MAAENGVLLRHYAHSHLSLGVYFTKRELSQVLMCLVNGSFSIKNCDEEYGESKKFVMSF